MANARNRPTTENLELRSGDSEVPALEDGLGFRLSRVARKLRSEWAAQLKPLALTPPQAAVVRAVSLEPGCSVRALARRLGADPMNVKRCVDELEKRGLIQSASVTTDRRPRALTVSASGQLLARDVGRLARLQQAELTATMTSAEMRHLTNGLERLEGRLGID